MSNPSRAPTVPLTEAQARLSELPVTYLKYPEQYDALKKAATKAGTIVEMMSGLDMGLANSFKLTDRDCQLARVVRAGSVLVATETDPPATSIRSVKSVEMELEAWKLLGPEEQELLRPLMLDTAYVSAGANWTLGRFREYYPRTARNRALVTAPTREEVEASYANSGLNHSSEVWAAIRPFPLETINGHDTPLRINAHSNNGLPTLVPFTDAYGKEQALLAARRFRVTIRQWSSEPGDFDAKYRALVRGSPHLFACLGKAKSDFYNGDKIFQKKIRFYNILPRHVILNHQVVAQPYDGAARHIGHNPNLHTAKGLSLAHGGAATLMDALLQQLWTTQEAYAHVGDDSMVYLQFKWGGKLYLLSFALDCSSFDLTQLANVKEPVLVRIYQDLAKIDLPAAKAWLAHMRWRYVVTAGAVTREHTHGGPSGSVLQSTVNDVLMDVSIGRVLREHRALLRRLEEAPGGGGGPQPLDEATVNQILQKVGEGLGLTIKVEQYRMREYPAEADHLSVEELLPITFVGYVIGTNCLPMADPLRLFPRFPIMREYIKAPLKHRCANAIRMGSIALNFGIPSRPYARAFRELLRLVIAELEEVTPLVSQELMESVMGHYEDSPFGPNVERSLAGLLAALRRPPMELWDLPEDWEGHPDAADMPGTPGALTRTWGDYTDELDNELLTKLGIVPPVGLPLDIMRKVGAFTTQPVATHPATEANSGRPPPTAVWGPDKPRRHRFAARLGRVYEDEEEGVIDYDYLDDYDTTPSVDYNPSEFGEPPLTASDAGSETWAEDMEEMDAEDYYGQFTSRAIRARDARK